MADCECLTSRNPPRGTVADPPLLLLCPCGRLPIEVVPGGLSFGCGRVVPELGDEDDTALVVVAATSIGFHDPTDPATRPATWDTREGH